MFYAVCCIILIRFSKASFPHYICHLYIGV
nr:MAG TPA: hypothetical protein [Caudoviricetes sp.]